MAKHRIMPVTHQSFAFWWIADRDMFRVWRSDWYEDQFEVLSADEFNTLMAMCKRFSFPFHESIDND